MLAESEVGLFLVDSGAGSTRGVKLSTCYAHQLNPETRELRRHPWPAEEKLTASTQKSPPEPMSPQSWGLIECPTPQTRVILKLRGLCKKDPILLGSAVGSVLPSCHHFPHHEAAEVLQPGGFWFERFRVVSL